MSTECVEAIIIAGGLGSRMWPLTEHRPKHVLPVAGVPFCLHQLLKLRAAGIEHVVLATSFHAEAFWPVLGDGSRWGLRLTYVREPERLGTAGAVRHAADQLQGGPGEPVLVLNGDQMSGHDLVAQVAVMGPDTEAVLHLIQVPDPAAYGCVPTARDGTVLAFLEKTPDPPTRQVNAGCYVLRRRLIDTIPPGQVVSIERETFPALLETGARIAGYREDSYWVDVGTPGRLRRASVDLVTGLSRSAAFVGTDPDKWAAGSADIAGSARLGGGTACDDEVVVERDAVVEGSVLMPGARVGAGAEIRDSILGFGAVVGARARVEGATIGDHATIGSASRLGVGSLVAGADTASTG